MKSKNLIIYYPSFERGGVEENIKNLINNFDNKLNIHLISSISSKNGKKIFKKKCKIYNVKKSKFLSFFPSRINSALSSMSSLYYLILKFKKKNLIVHSMQSNIAAIIICLILNVKIIIRNSEDPIYSTIHAENFIISSLMFVLKIFFYNLCDGIITNSLGSKLSLEKIVFRKNKIKTIYNPYLKKLNKKNYNKKKYLINVGRFRKQKNQILLIKAFNDFCKVYKDYKLLIVGDGILKEKLIQTVRSLNLSQKVMIINWTRDPLKYIKNSKLFILTSLYEGLGNVLIDAINYNVPCISTNCKSGPSEILVNGQGGYLVKNDNVSELSKKMIYCVKNYNLALKKNKIAKQNLNRFNMLDRVKEYENYLLNFEN